MANKIQFFTLKKKTLVKMYFWTKKIFTLFFSLFSGHSATMAGGGPSPHTVYESYHQQFRQLKRQQSSPMGSARQLPMAPFGHRRTASSSSFGGYQQPADLTSPGI